LPIGTRAEILSSEASRLAIQVVAIIFGFSDGPVILVVLVVLLVAAITIVLVFDLILEISIVASASVSRVVLLFPGIAVDAIAFAIGDVSFDLGVVLRHAAERKCKRPKHKGCRYYCQKLFHIFLDAQERAGLSGLDSDVESIPNASSDSPDYRQLDSYATNAPIDRLP